MSVALIQEVRQAIGFKQQANLVTAVPQVDMWSLRQTNEELIQAQPVNEDDGNDLGKGVYVTELFPSFIDGKGPWNGYTTAESMAMLQCFGMGKATKTSTVATGGFKYVSHQPNFSTDGIDMPTTSAAIQIRTSTDAITDKLIVGLACEEWGLSLKVGPGRANSTFTSNWVGTGAFTRPSGITIPSLYDETILNAGSVSAMNFIGFDYLANKRFVSLDFKWKNNIRDQSSYYPGSGNQSQYQLRGRMRRGVPQFTLNATVECDSGSNEEDLLLSQTLGTGRITLTGPVIASGPEAISFDIQFFKIGCKATPISNADGIASYNIEYFVMQHPSNGVCQMTSIVMQDNILAVAP